MMEQKDGYKQLESCSTLERHDGQSVDMAKAVVNFSCLDIN